MARHENQRALTINHGRLAAPRCKPSVPILDSDEFTGIDDYCDFTEDIASFYDAPVRLDPSFHLLLTGESRSRANFEY